MRTRTLWAAFLFLLTILPLFLSFANGVGKFPSIEEAGPLLGGNRFEQPLTSNYFFSTLLKLHNIQPNNSLGTLQQEALAHQVPASTFFSTLFKTISPNVFFNLRSVIFTLSCFNLFLWYLLLRQVLAPELAGVAVAMLAWLPQFAFFSTHVCNQPLIFLLFLLSLHFLLQWQNVLTSHQRCKSWCMTIICGTFLGFSLATQLSPLPLLIFLAATIGLWLEYRQSLFSFQTLLFQSLLMLLSCLSSAFALTPALWLEPLAALQNLWKHFMESVSIAYMLNNDALNPSIFSWIKLARNFTDLPHFMPTTLIRQEILALLMLFAAVVYLLARGSKKQEHSTSPLQSQNYMQSNTLFMAACATCMLSVGSFLLNSHTASLYLFWPWLAVAASCGFSRIIYALTDNTLSQIRKPCLYAILLSINIFICSKSPWFETVQRNLTLADPAQQIAYLESAANRSTEPEAYWNRIALLHLYERNRIQAKIFALKTLSHKPFDPAARFIVQHLHEKELKL